MENNFKFDESKMYDPELQPLRDVEKKWREKFIKNICGQCNRNFAYESNCFNPVIDNSKGAFNVSCQNYQAFAKEKEKGAGDENPAQHEIWPKCKRCGKSKSKMYTSRCGDALGEIFFCSQECFDVMKKQFLKTFGGEIWPINGEEM